MRRGEQAQAEAVLRTLGEGSAEEKEGACRAISAVLCAASQPSEPGGVSAATLVEGFGTRLVAPLCELLAPSAPSALALAAAAALRNLCVAGGVLVCEKAVAEAQCVRRVLSLLPSAVARANKPVAAAAAAATDDDDDEDEDEGALATQLFMLLTQLCENVEAALDQVTAAGVVDAALEPLLSSSSSSSPSADVRLVAARLAHTATDANAQLARRLTAQLGAQSFASACAAAAAAELASATGCFELAAMLLGVAHNVCRALGDAAAELACTEILLPQLRAVLDSSDAVAMLAALAPQLQVAGGEMEDEELAVSAPPEQMARWKGVVAAQQIALETLANAACDADQDASTMMMAPGEDAEDGAMETDEEAAAKTETDVDSVAGQQPAVESGSATAAPSAVVAAIAGSGVMASVAAKALNGLSQAQAVAQQHPWASIQLAPLVVMQARACSCIANFVIANGPVTEADALALWRTAANNISEALPIARSVSPAGFSPAPSPSPGGSASFSHLDSVATELLEESSGLLGALAMRFPAQVPTWMPAAQLPLLLRIARSDCSEGASIHALSVLGAAAGSVAAAEHSIREQVTSTLLGVAMDDASGLELVSAAVNAVIDLFAEAPESEADRPLHRRILETLRQLLPSFRHRIAVQRRRLDRALLDRLEETRINLSRLIKYKAKQQL